MAFTNFGRSILGVHKRNDFGIKHIGAKIITGTTSGEAFCIGRVNNVSGGGSISNIALSVQRRFDSPYNTFTSQDYPSSTTCGRTSLAGTTMPPTTETSIRYRQGSAFTIPSGLTSNCAGVLKVQLGAFANSLESYSPQIWASITDQVDYSSGTILLPGFGDNLDYYISDLPYGTTSIQSIYVPGEIISYLSGASLTFIAGNNNEMSNSGSGSTSGFQASTFTINWINLTIYG
jgi:hypothetical protein